MSQSELEDLLIVFGDLEDKVAKYKVCEITQQRYMAA